MNDIITLENMSEHFLTDVKRSNLLSDELLSKVENMLPELKHNMITQTIWRTETEIRCSVLNDKDFPDKSSKYHQAKLEQMVFFEQLLQLSFEYRKTQQELFIKESEIEELEERLLDNELKQYEIKKLNAQLNIKLIEKEEITYRLQNMKIQGKERVRELEIWSKIKSELDDNTFDKDNKDENQLISLTRRYIQEAYIINNSKSASDTAGFNNIIAQFNSLCIECIKRNKLDEVLSYFGEGAVSSWVREIFNVK